MKAEDILIVEDTPARLGLLTSILTGAGYRVRPASDGLSVLRSVAACPPALILLAGNMPGMDGFEICRRLKADLVSSAIPVLFLSATDETAEKVRIFQAGGADYITWPFIAEEVLARVATHWILGRARWEMGERNTLVEQHIALERRVLEQADALGEKTRETERFNHLAVDRERRILELKEQVNALAQELGREPEFRITSEILGRLAVLVPPQVEPLPAVETRFAELLDFSRIKQLLDHFCAVVGISSGIIDLHGTVIIASHWQRLCADFHRTNPQTCARCLESDTDLSLRLQEGEQFALYNCKNGLTDAASPVIVDGQHVANVFVGQFLLQPPDRAFFARQALAFGFSPDDYLAALDDVPVVPHANLSGILGFLTGLAQLVALLTLERKQALDTEAIMRQERAAALSLAEDAEHARAEKARYQERLEEMVQERTDQLARSRKLLQLVLDTIPVGVFWKDRACVYLGGNARWARDAGLPNPEAGIGKTDYDMAWQRVADLFRADDQEVIRSGQAKLDFEEPTILAGQPGWLRTSKMPLTDEHDQIIGVLGTYEVITKRKQTELEREQYYTLFKTASDLMCIADPLGCFQKVNPALLETLGYTESELLARPFVDFIHPEDQQRTRDEMNRQLQRGFSLNFENRYICKDGSSRWLSWRAVFIKSEGLTYATARDITERKQAAARLLELNASLEKRVQERTAELQATNQELESFAHSVSHDLRAPLRAISGFSQALLEDYGAQLPGEAQAYLDMLQESSQEMGRLIDGLLRLSRVTRGEMSKEKVDLSGLADKVMAALQQTEPDRRVTVTIAPRLAVYGNAQLLGVAMENLLGNAWKYTGKTRQAEISFDSIVQEGKKVYRVRDNGAGFNMKYTDKLFAPFQRLHRVDEFPGHGIGLATTQRIIHRHGGLLWGQAEVGKGATFFFTLPEQEA
ncbi:MAG: PocR ligand-binding domain-containing protein [Magnetococcales bacterium]|nr:PocR ligand-binding domain-containing protein [Magnetococcales bacterium]